MPAPRPGPSGARMPAARPAPAALATSALAATAALLAGCTTGPGNDPAALPLAEQTLQLAPRAMEVRALPVAARGARPAAALGGGTSLATPTAGRWTWLPAEYGPGGDRVAVQTSSLVRHGATVRFWTLTNLRAPRPLAGGSGPAVASMRADLSVNCAERTTRTNGIYLYPRPGAQGDLLPAPRLPELGWVLVAPGSLGADIFHQACAGQRLRTAAATTRPADPRSPDPPPARFLVEPVPEALPAE